MTTPTRMRRRMRVLIGLQTIAIIIGLGSIEYSYHSVAVNRQQTILRDCQQQNSRHDTTIAFFKRYVAGYERSHPRMSTAARRDLESSVQGNIVLINDLQPYQNCYHTLKLDTRGGK